MITLSPGWGFNVHLLTLLSLRTCHEESIHEHHKLDNLHAHSNTPQYQPNYVGSYNQSSQINRCQISVPEAQ